jgi:hypothetical protein
MRKHLVTLAIAVIMMITVANSPKYHPVGHGLQEDPNGPWWSPTTWATWVLNYIDGAVSASHTKQQPQPGPGSSNGPAGGGGGDAFPSSSPANDAPLTQ